MLSSLAYVKLEKVNIPTPIAAAIPNLEYFLTMFLIISLFLSNILVDIYPR